MKLAKHEIIGLLLIFAGVILAFIGFYWTPLLIAAFVLILIGTLLWNPFHLIP